MKAILTSAGFDNDNLVPVFHELLGQPVEKARALFVPTALDTPGSREYIPVFMEDLYKVGFDDNNIDQYDLDKPLDSVKIKEYSVVFVCPGNPDSLMQKISEREFHDALKVFFDNGGVYIGVSAGSDIIAMNLPDSLGYLNATIECHAKEGSPAGPLDTSDKPMVKITDNQAIVINGSNIRIVE